MPDIHKSDKLGVFYFLIRCNATSNLSLKETFLSTFSVLNILKQKSYDLMQYCFLTKSVYVYILFALFCIKNTKI